MHPPTTQFIHRLIIKEREWKGHFLANKKFTFSFHNLKTKPLAIKTKLLFIQPKVLFLQTVILFIVCFCKIQFLCDWSQIFHSHEIHFQTCKTQTTDNISLIPPHFRIFPKRKDQHTHHPLAAKIENQTQIKEKTIKMPEADSASYCLNLLLR